jgi:Uma2 family endonuclease
MVTTRALTVEEFDLLPDDGRLWELVDGELAEKMPAGGESSELGMLVGTELTVFVRPRGLGRVYGADAGFLLRADPPLIRSPDAAFVRADRLPPREERRGTLRLAPDLAVEVVSPSDRLPDVRAKVREYLAAGTRLVWVIEPRQQTVTVYPAGGDAYELREGDTLDGDVLPGFRLAVADLFL